MAFALAGAALRFSFARRDGAAFASSVIRSVPHPDKRIRNALSCGGARRRAKKPVQGIRRGGSTQAAVTARAALPTWDVPVGWEWVNDPTVGVIGWSVVLISLAIIKVAISDDKNNTPKAFLKHGTGQTTPVVCLGDSLTRGNLSADWVGGLRDHLAETLAEPSVVLNAGVNMECTPNVKKRLDEVIACSPSHVTVLVGTNDMKAELSAVERVMYRLCGKLSERPTLQAYEDDLIEIRDRLLAAGSCVALVSPPVLGEDRGCPANRRASAFASVVKRIAAGGGERCTYLPLFERTYEALPVDGGKAYCGVSFFKWCCLLALDIHWWGRDLKAVQQERNLGVTVDLVHLGPVAAEAMVEMTASFVKSFPPLPETRFARALSV